jgi:hypothetical protein
MTRERTALLPAAFLVTFVLTRAYTRAARVRSWGSGSVGGVHLHHIVVRIVLVLVSGLIEIASTRRVRARGSERLPLTRDLLEGQADARSSRRLRSGRRRDRRRASRQATLALLRHFYDDAKRARAQRRFDCSDFWLHRLHERFDDLVGGAPTPQMIAIQWRKTR